MRTLDPAHLVLSGRRLIEASAGTGKTFNITRIYLRALLEKQYSVHQILVLTFTEAATDELKQRISEYLHQVIKAWWDTQDPFLLTIQRRVDMQDAYTLLKLAVVDVDDASIFTIHGFCQRLLTQYATSFQYASDAEVTLDTKNMLLRLIADSLVKWRADESFFESLEVHGLATPEAILEQFHDVFFKQAKVDVVDSKALAADLKTSVEKAWAQSDFLRKNAIDFISANREYFLEGLSQTQKNHDLIFNQLDALQTWLAALDNVIFNENEQAFEQAVESANNAAAEKCILHPLFKTLVENKSRKNNYQPDFYSRLTGCFKPLKTQLLSGLRFEGAVILNQSNKLPVFEQIVSEIQSIKQKLNRYFDEHKLISFDYMIEKVAQSLASSVENNHLIKAIGEQYPIAMIDEFQDTDASQYLIFDRLYPAHTHSRSLIMIGDPKQAIYAFRGGDVFTYIDAKTNADESLTMTVNWRSSYAMINAVNNIFKNANTQQLGPEIAFHEVSGSDSSKAQQNPMQSWSTSSDIEDALHVVFSNDNKVARTLSDEYAHRTELIGWMATEIIELLNDTGFKHKDSQSQCALQPKDIAILVRTGVEASRIRNELKKYNLDTVYLSERTPLFSSKQAKDLLCALDAILHMDDSEKLRVGISTGLFLTDIGMQVDAVLCDDLHKDWQKVISHMVNLKSIWMTQGLYAVTYAIIRTATPNKHHIERNYANLLHLAEEFAQLEITVRDPYEQCRWLKKQINHADSSSVELRLESDKALIKIITMHKSKGLEYPVVFIPFVNAGTRFSKKAIYPHHDDTNQLKITLGYSTVAAEKAKAEYEAESMRLLYVAVTRSLYRCYLGVIVSSVASTSALHRLLNLEALGNEDDAKAYCERFTAAMRHQCSKASNNLVFRKAQARTSEHYSTTNKDPILLHQTSTRKVTPTWQMSSFSRITKTSENAIVQARDSDDTPENDKRLIAIEKLIDHESLLRFKMTPGADSGNLLHDSLENIDFQRPDFQSAWNDIRGKYSWFDVTMLNELSSWLTECLVTPILNDGCSLAKLTSSAVLKESNFYMPSTAVPGRDFVRLLTAHRENIKQVCNLSNVKTPFFIDQKTNLMLQGFIDLVFEHKGKYYVVDYKSSFLGPTFEDYSAKRIWENMQSHNYDLQYHLYTLALHRLLQQRIDDYSPATHLGGVIYLYLRGMHPDKPQCGVFFSPLDTLCLKEIDDLFESGK